MNDNDLLKIRPSDCAALRSTWCLVLGREIEYIVEHLQDLPREFVRGRQEIRKIGKHLLRSQSHQASALTIERPLRLRPLDLWSLP